MLGFLEVLIEIVGLLLSWRFYLCVFTSAMLATLAWLALPEQISLIAALVIGITGPVLGILWSIRTGPD